MRKYRKIEVSSFWTANNHGDIIEGEVIIPDVCYNSRYGDSTYTLLKTASGDVKVGWSAGLSGALEQVKAGDYIKITYQGEQFNTKTKRRFKSYDVEIAE